MRAPEVAFVRGRTHRGCPDVRRPTDALDEVAEATKGALRGGRTLAKNELHDELRERVGANVLPWCTGCKSHHVAPMLWRYGGGRPEHGSTRGAGR